MEQSISYWENAAKSVRTKKERWYKHHLGSKDTSAKHRQKKYLKEVLESREERKKKEVNRSKLERSNRDKRLQDNKFFVQEWGEQFSEEYLLILEKYSQISKILERSCLYCLPQGGYVRCAI
jgi:hypothetical protein